MSDFRSRAASLSATVTDALARIDAAEDINAFITTLPEQAQERAVAIEKRVADGTAGRLAGMTVAIKDNIAVEGVGLTCGSRMLENFTSLYSATAVERLEAEDAIIIGKTNLDEFAMGSSNENSAFGNVKNPLDKSRVPGGSSGGSAAAVAAGLVDVALGSETGGSVRQPAAFTGTVGVKPTHGRISRYGLVAFASSFDAIGPIARNVHDAALVTEVIAGGDPKDMTSSDREVGDYSDGLDGASIEGLTIGLPTEYRSDGLDPEIAARLEETVAQAKDAGAKFVDISLPHTDYVIPTYYVLATAEASSNLARYDGVRFGHRTEGVETVEELYERSRSEGFGDEVQRRIMLGTFVLSSGYYDAYYKRGQQVRSLICRDFARAFEQVDLVLAPTTPSLPFAFGEKTDDPIAMYLSDIFTAAANISGIPALNVPTGTSPSTNLPIGLQLMAPRFGEELMFRAGAWLESVQG